MFTVFLTSVYTFRGFFLTFYGPERVPHEAGHHAHESPSTITVPLIILALAAFGIGGYFEFTGGFRNFLLRTPSLAYDAAAVAEPAHFHTDVAVVSTAIVALGIGLAAFLYLGDRRQAAWLAARLRPLYVASYNKLYIDEIYQVLFVWPLWVLAQVCAMFDNGLVDGLVNLTGRIPPAIGSLLRLLQTGMVQFYALAMVLGVLVLIGTLMKVWPM
jgi:NADH:ubiquinone oxidoreductase subunit 5 (subunit L)/multisubunit Na+/H+ antiporter MnhA subunit